MNSGMAATSAMRRISAWPGSSAGCALPAKMNTTGRCGSLTICFSHDRFWNSSVARL